MTLRLNGSSSGHTEIKAPAAAGDNTITLPTSNGSAEQFVKNSGTAGELEFSSMVETSTGIGIGTTSPEDSLHIKSNSGAIRLENSVVSNNDSTISYDDDTLAIHVDANNVRGSSAITFSGDGSERLRISDTGKTTITGATNGELSIKAGSSSGDDIIAFLNSGGTTRGNITYDTDDNFLLFNVNQSERARILSDGRFLVGTTSALSDGLICFKGTFASNRGLILETTESSGEMIRFNTSTGNAGKIDSNGTSTTYGTSSDYRLKENIVDLDGAIDRVKQLAPKRFNFLCDADTTVDGFLAHEAQTVVPEAITGTHNGVEVWRESDELPDGVSVGDTKLDEDGNAIPDYQCIDQSKLVPLLTAALQEAISKIETLETKVAALEAA